MKYLLLILFVGGVIWVGSSTSEIKRVMKMRIDVTLADRFIHLLEDLGIQNPVVVLAQAILETGNFKSRIAMENNNHFGMKYNRRGYASGIKNGHAYYSDVIDSYLDYRDWQLAMLHGDTLSDDQYLERLNNPWKDGRRYAEDPLYTEKLKIIMKKIRACCTVEARPELEWREGR